MLVKFWVCWAGRCDCSTLGLWNYDVDTLLAEQATAMVEWLAPGQVDMHWFKSGTVPVATTVLLGTVADIRKVQ